jgi:putative hydrolase of the HAD superfamily
MEPRYLLVDLDRTVYPGDTELEREISRRMTAFVAGHLGIAPEQAERARRENFPRYGSTLRWLREEHGMGDPEEFLESCHPADVERYLEPDPLLRDALASVRIPKAILTNSISEHAERVLSRLGIRDLFERVFDLRFSGYRGKPDPSTYRGVLRALGMRAPEVLFVDDSISYLTAFREMGGQALLVSGASQGGGLPWIRRLAELPAYLTGLEPS